MDVSSLVNSAGAVVQLHEHPLAGDRLLAEARLNSEPTLNALSLDMIEILSAALDRWAADERVVAVLLSGAGDRAFSAGGDIQALYRAMTRNHAEGERVDDYPYTFFEREYRLDYRLHTYAKPVVALGHGVVMGGGLGIFSAARFRLVAENVRIALPEVGIGLFPDAGGTWLLRNLDAHFALFMGMTGSHINAADAMLVGLGTHAVAATELEAVRRRLIELAWTGRAEDDAALIDGCLAGQAAPTLPDARLPQVPDDLAIDVPLGEAVAAIEALDGGDEWLRRGVTNLRRGCPTSVGVVLEQLKRARGQSGAPLDLAGCFRMEMIIATHCADNHDFAEGVRALLIDKDNSPTWQFGSIADLPDAYVQSHFLPPWPQNPLDDLEETT